MSAISDNVTEAIKVPQGKKTTGFVKAEGGLKRLYANNVGVESTIWDLRLIFGDLISDDDGNPVVQQHTSVAMPWNQAKVLCFYLALNVIGYEEDHGPVRLQKPIIPAITSLTEKARNNPRIMAILSALMEPGNPELFGSQEPSNEGE